MSTSTRFLRLAALTALAAALAACSNTVDGVRFTRDGSSSKSSSSSAKVQPIRSLSATEIKTAIVGKTFQYTRPDGNGFVTYNANGTFDYQDDTRGNGTGQWAASDGKFCEVFGAGAPQDCGEFKSTGDAYFAAKSRLVEMKV